MLPSSCFRCALLSCTGLVAATSLGWSAAAAAPQIAQPGASTISVQTAGGQTTVSQTTARAVVDWSAFDVATDEAVRFNQPDSRSATLNRVHSPWTSAIDGTITAPGRVIIQNANGVVFGGSARIDVGSLIASSLTIDEGQFRDNGRLVFNGGANSDAIVSNAGSITVGQAGLVALIGPRVANSGVISARLGTVALVAGNAATIDFSGDGLVQIAVTDPTTARPTASGALVVNSGRISADGGSVLLTADTAGQVISRAINLDGLIEARGIDGAGGKVALLGGPAGQINLGPEARIDASGTGGGAVVVTGAAVALSSGARIDASGDIDGGVIRIGGGYQGREGLARARVTAVEAGAVLDTSGHSGAGGSVVVWSDEQTRFDGVALAQAGAASGGLVETSSAGRLLVGDQARVSTISTSGPVGAWLLDPTSISVVASGGGAGSPNDANQASGASTINAATVVTALASNQVILQASDYVSVDAPIVATSLGGVTPGLQLIATAPGSQIRVNAPILLQDGNLALRAEGDILLGTAAPAETDFARRAIIAVGSGTVWLQTRGTTDSGTAPAIRQAPNSAILAANLAAIGGVVDLSSWDNFTLNLAGSARNGTFDYRQTNATGTVNVGTVSDPFVVQSLTGVLQSTSTLVGTRDIVAANAVDWGTPENGDEDVVLDAGGQAFNTLVFSSLPYSLYPGGAATPPASTTTDSSDYVVRRLAYDVGGGQITISPETDNTALSGRTAPAGFRVSAASGTVVRTNNPAYASGTLTWGVLGFTGVGGTDDAEIEYDPIQNISQNLIFQLGGSTTQVTATLRQFFTPDFGEPYAETARIRLYQTTTTTATPQARQGLLSGTAASFTRQYGDANPALTFLTTPAYNPVDAYVASQIGGYSLPAAGLATSAVAASPVSGSPYAIVVTPPSSQFVDDRYAMAFTNGALTVTPAPLTIISNTFSKAYGQPDPTLTYAVTGMKLGQTATAALTGGQSRAPGEDVAIYATNQGTLAPSGNYTIASYTPGALAITPIPLTVLADSDGRAYGDANPAWITTGQTGHYSLSGLIGSDGAGADPVRLTSINYATPATVASNVGDYAITPSNGLLAGAKAGNYTLVYANGELEVRRAPLLVAVHDADRLYGDANPAFGYGVTGWKNGDQTINTVTSVVTTPATVASHVGDYALTPTSATFTGAAINNYTITTQAGVLTVLPAPLIIQADDQSRLYDEDNPPLTWTTTGWRNGDDAATTSLASLSTTAVRLSNVGDYPISVDAASLVGPNQGDYVVTLRPGLLVISPAPLLLVSADDYRRIYGDDNPTFTYRVAGWRANDQASNNVSADLSSLATPASNVGDYAISVLNAQILGPASGNYTLRTQDGVLTIVPAPLLISAESAGRLYGDDNPTFAAYASGWRNGDEAVYTISASLSSLADRTTSVGSAPIDITAPGLIGPNPANYTLDVAPGELTISPAPLTVEAGRYAKIYGDADPALGFQVEGLRNSDTAVLVLAGGVARDPGENVGAYGVRQGSLSLTSSNYVLSFIDGQLTIAPAALHVAIADAAKIYGDPDPAFTYGVSGLKFADTAAAVLTGAPSRGAGETVGLYPILQGGLALTSSNYVLTVDLGRLSITPAPLIVTGGTYGKTYGDPDPAFGYSVQGLRNADVVAGVLNGALDRDPGENVGRYGVTQGTLELASINYTLSYVNGFLGITAAPIDVVALPGDKVVGRPDPPLTYVVDGLRRGDSPEDVVSGNVARAPGEDVGTYPIGLGSVLGINPNYVINFVPAPFDIIPEPTIFLQELTARSYDPWRIDWLERGRDPDTAGDAVYRTTRYENPFIPDPHRRAYGLGGVRIASTMTLPPMLGDETWRDVDNDRTGQHIDRLANEACPAANAAMASLCSAAAPLAKAWSKPNR